MKFKAKENIGRKRIRGLVLIGLIIISVYLGGFFYILKDIFLEPTEQEIDSDEFIPINLTEMATMAEEFEYWVKNYHLPMNYTLSLLWNDDYSEVTQYLVTGDAAIWTGVMLGTQCFRYAAAKDSGNSTEVAEALLMVKRVLTGVSLLLAVPNGGIGPEYGGILARSVVAPNQNYSMFPHFENPNPLDIFNGTGDYSEWLYLGYPSIDQNSGIIFGLTRAAISVAPDDPWVANLTSLLTQQLTEHYIRTNWQITDANGRTTGQDIKISMEESGFAVLSILKMATLANPESSRYAQLYWHYAYERGYIHILQPLIPLQFYNYFNYYSLNLYLLLFFNLAESETDPFLRARYIRMLDNQFYATNKASRNAWYNVAYLGIKNQTNPVIAADIGDQLMRFNLTAGPNGTNRVPDRGGGDNPIPSSQTQPERLTYWVEQLNSSSISGFLYGWMVGMLPNPNEILNSPKTVDQYPQEDFLWQRTPWTIGFHWSGEDYRQDSGIAYLLPYYMGMYYHIWEVSS